MKLNKEKKYVITVERLKNNLISPRDADELIDFVAYGSNGVQHANTISNN